jgi:hypothetical protein
MLFNNMNKQRFHILFFKRVKKSVSPIVKSEKTQIYFTITLSLFTLSFFGLFAIRPTLMTAISLIKSVSILKQLNVKYENKISSIIKTQAEYEKARNDLYLIDIALPNNAFFSKLAVNLENIANESGVTIQQMQINNSSISDTPPSDKPLPLGFALITTGDYFSVMSYIKHLVNWKRIVN